MRDAKMPRCLNCKTTLREPEEGSELAKLNEMLKNPPEGISPMPTLLECPNCGLAWSRDNPYLYPDEEESNSPRGNNPHFSLHKRVKRARISPLEGAEPVNLMEGCND